LHVTPNGAKSVNPHFSESLFLGNSLSAAIPSQWFQVWVHGKRLADLHEALGRTSLHGQSPPPQETSLLATEPKSPRIGKGNQGFGMCVRGYRVPVLLAEHRSKHLRIR
jgi:hypothetical protein